MLKAFRKYESVEININYAQIKTYVRCIDINVCMYTNIYKGRGKSGKV